MKLPRVYPASKVRAAREFLRRGLAFLDDPEIKVVRAPTSDPSSIEKHRGTPLCQLYTALQELDRLDRDLPPPRRR